MDSNKQNDTGVHLSPDGIAWQNKDISSKYLAEIFGQEFFDIFNLRLPAFVSLERTELPAIEVSDMMMDNLMCLADGSLAIVDYESKYSEENKVKYFGYIARLIKREYNKKHKIPRIHVIIIYTADVAEGRTDPVLDMGDSRLELTEVFLTGWDSKAILESAEKKILSGGKLSHQEQLKLMICPLSAKGRENKVQIIGRCIKILDTIPDDITRKKISAGLISFCNKIISKSDFVKLRRMIQMNWFDELIIEEAEKEAVKMANEMASEMASEMATEMTNKEVNDHTIRIARNFLASGTPVESVSQNTGLEMDTVIKLAEELQKEAVV